MELTAAECREYAEIRAKAARRAMAEARSRRASLEAEADAEFWSSKAAFYHTAETTGHPFIPPADLVKELDEEEDRIARNDYLAEQAARLHPNYHLNF
jgi:hypothetical protein